MKSLFRSLRAYTGALLTAATCCATSSALADTNCCLELPAIPNNEADGIVKATFGPSPLFPGVAPHFSYLTVDILPGGGGSPTPPIDPGNYAAWCSDVLTELPVLPAGTLYGGYLFSTCDPTTSFNQYLPDHPNVMHDAATWKKINYLINHRFQACNGLLPRMWEVQRAMWTIFNQSMTTVPSPPYPQFRQNVVDCLVNDANANAAAWTPACGDKVAVIFNVDINWDNIAPEVQLMILEVPYCPPITCPTNVTIDCSQTVSLDPNVNPILGKPTSCCSVTSSYVDSLSISNCPGSYSITRTWTASNGCRTNTCTQTITVTDTSIPELTVPPGGDLGCNPDVLPTDESIKAIATANDTCGTPTIEVTHVDLPDGCIVVRRFTVTAVDQCGNRSEPQTVIYSWKFDLTPPVLIGLPPATASYQCLGDVPPAPTVTALDNCDGTLDVTYDPSVSGDPCNLTIVRIWTVKDSCGNEAKFTQTITVKDITAPILKVPADALVECTAVPGVGSASAIDNCDTNPAVHYLGETSSTVGCTNTYVRTWMAIDVCGNATTNSQTLTVVDTTAPILIGVPADSLVECTNVPAIPTVTASDACSTAPIIPLYGEKRVDGNCAGNYTLIRTWIAIDLCGNAVTNAQTITVRDTTPPTITCVADKAAVCGQPWSFDAPSATDACSGATVSIFSTTTNAATCGYSVTRVWVATDDCGNKSQCSQTVTVTDTTAPVITCVANKSVQCGQAWSFDAPGATDACGSATVSIISTTTNAATCGYSVTRVWEAKDNCNNKARCSQTVTIIDTTKPVITCVANKTVECGQAWSFNTPTATDNCGTATITIVSTTTNAATCGYSVTRKWKATDACGNYNECTQTVTVVDNTAPVITCVADKTVECGKTWSFDAPTATDTCGSATVTVVSTTTTTNDCTITSIRKWKATDACGNTAECTQKVTIDCGSGCIPGTFQLEGNTSTDGSDGNVKTFAATNGVSVKVSAWSRNKTTGAWSPSFLGQYGGGAGVTDPTEGTGGNNSHTVDNSGEDNFVLFEFSEPVAAKEVCLGYVVTDSDFTAWIGTFNNPFNNHLAMNDTVLGNFGYSENNAGGSSARCTDINTNDVMGNVLLIAAKPGDSNDYFKIKSLEICKRSCTPPPPPCKGSICGDIYRDCNADGSLSGEEGLAGFTVKLKNTAGTVLYTTTSDADGGFCFSNLNSGTYTVEVTPKSGYCQTYDPDGTKNDKTSIVVGDCQNKTTKFGYTGLTPAVSLIKTGPAAAKVGETITYTFYVTNTGNTCLYGGMSIDDPQLGGVIWHQTPVVPGEGFVIKKTYTIKASDPKNLCNTAKAIGHPPGGLNTVYDDASWCTTITNTTIPKPPCPDVEPGNCKVTVHCYHVAGCYGCKVKRSTTKGGSYTTIKSGFNGDYYYDTTCENGKVYYYVTSCTVGGKDSPDSDEACTVPSAGLPSPWATKNIGSVQATGGASYDSGPRKFTIIGSGEDIWNTSDEFRFVYQQAGGNCSIVARVTSVGDTDGWAKAGVMIRETLTAGSEHASVFVTPDNGVAAQFRESANGESGNDNDTGLTAPYWVKLVRNSNTFTASRSSNGSTWTTMWTKTIYMSSTVYIGLGVTAHNDGAACTATFDNVTATP